MTTISAPRPARGFWHRRLAGDAGLVVIYNRRGRVVLWLGGRVPVNGPALWWAAAVCGVAGAVGGRL